MASRHRLSEEKRKKKAGSIGTAKAAPAGKQAALRSVQLDEAEQSGLPRFATMRSAGEATILQMQHSHGNTFVQRALAKSSEKRPTWPEYTLPAIQRQDAGENIAPATRQEDMTLDISTIHLRGLWEYPINITHPATMNESANTLLGRLREATVQSSDLRDELGYLRYAGETGPQGLEAVQAIQGDIGQHAAGRAGEYLRTVTERYTGANNNIRAHLPKLRASQQAIASAAAHLQAVILKGQIVRAEREKTSAGEKVAAVQARISRAKGLAEGVIGPAINLLQGKWKEAGIDLAKFIGKEIVNAMVDVAYAPELQLAQTQLREAKANVEHFQDEELVAELEATTNDLGSKNSEAEAAQLELMAVVWQAEEAHSTLTEELQRMGHTEAAEALDARATTMEASARTLQKLNQYETRIQIIKRHSQTLKNLNQALAQLMLSPGGPSVVPREEHRLDMWDSADHNAKELERIEMWTQNELTVVASTRGFVEGSDYLKAYNQIDTALHEAIIYR